MNGKPAYLPSDPIEVEDEAQPLLVHHGSASDIVQLNDPEHPSNPMNLPAWRKWACAAVLGAMTFASTFSSSAFNAAITITAREFNVLPETMALATSLYIFGFATGPILAGPASELLGRKMPFFTGYAIFILTQIPVALAHDAATVLLFRFLGGVASSVSPAIVGGYLADFLPPVERGVVVVIFAATTLIGPSTGAITGAVLVQSSLGWRWTAWTSMILGIAFGVIGLVLLPETYLPVLEQREARRLRRVTGNWALHSRLDEKPVHAREFIIRYLTRPAVMLAMEPILLSMTLYISFTFGMVYLLFVVSITGSISTPAIPLTFVPGLPSQFCATTRFRSCGRHLTSHRRLHWHLDWRLVRLIL